MNIPTNHVLYDKAKALADSIYDKPSAYKSGFIVKTYKEMGGEYTGSKTKQGLTEWFSADWKDIGNKAYPVYRPTKRVSAKTPLTINEIDPINLRKQIQLKQKIRGNRNLPPFKKKE
jgi:hypothetical protein